jgi:hypothetical protein
MCTTWMPRQVRARRGAARAVVVAAAVVGWVVVVGLAFLLVRGDWRAAGGAALDALVVRAEAGLPPAACVPPPRPVRRWEDDIAADAAYQAATHAYVRAHTEARLALDRRSDTPPPRVLVHTVTARDATGGLGDRLHGVFSSALLARLTGRAFFLRWTKPVPLSAYWAPAALAWEPDPAWPWAEADGPNPHTAVRLDVVDDCAPLQQWLRGDGTDVGEEEGIGQSEWWAAALAPTSAAPVVVINTNCYVVDAAMTSPHYAGTAAHAALAGAYARGDLTAALGSLLFRPSCLMAAAVAATERAVAGAAAVRLAVHVRTGGDPATFHDPARTTVALPVLLAAYANATAALHAALAADGRPASVFVMTDAAAVTAQLRHLLAARLPGAHVWSLPAHYAAEPAPSGDEKDEGEDGPARRVRALGVLPLTHLDRDTGPPTVRAHLRTFLEWSLYARADGHVIARSMYSLAASRLACVPAIEVHPSTAAASALVRASPLLHAGCCVTMATWAAVPPAQRRWCDLERDRGR